MKSFRVKFTLLTLGMIAGFAYEAFATEPKKDNAAAPAAAAPAPATAAPAAAAPAAAAPKAVAVPAAPAPAPAAAAAPKAAAPAAPATAAAAPATAPAPAPAAEAKKQNKKASKKAQHEGVEGASRRTLAIEQHTAEIVQVDKDVAEIFVANPDIADVTVNAPGVAYIYGKKPGVTTVFASTKDGRIALNMEIDVTYNLRPLKRAINQAYPNEHVTLESTPTGIVLNGDVTSPIVSREMINLAQRYIGDKDTVINNLGISMPTQVYISVKVAEVNRTVLRQLNVNLAMTDKIGDFAFGILTGRPAYATNANNAFTDNGNPGFIRSGGPSGTFGGRLTSKHYPQLDIVGVLDTLNREGLSTLLAEPNLVCLSGETGKVLLGGEFPYPVPQGNNTVTVAFKQFGVQLDVTPTILSGNLINLHVRPEVSALDRANGVSISTGINQNETIPALKTRRSETTVELGSGSSLAIAGLINSAMSNTIDEYPWMAEIPVIGALFRSPKFQRDESELVIIVTPYLVEPVRDHDLKTPLEGLEYASMLGMILSGRLNNPRNSPEKSFEGFTAYLADSADDVSVNDVSFETNLADGSGIPTNDQSSSETRLFNRPDDLGQSSDESFAGLAGFYVQ